MDGRTALSLHIVSENVVAGSPSHLGIRVLCVLVSFLDFLLPLSVCALGALTYFVTSLDVDVRQMVCKFIGLPSKLIA
jgi:hypothetical protein